MGTTRKEEYTMRKIFVMFLILVFIPLFQAAGDTIKWDEAPTDKLYKLLDNLKQTEQEEVIAKDFMAVSGNIGEVTIVKFVNDQMNVYFTNKGGAKNAMPWAEQFARNALDFFLTRTVRTKGTVAFYSSNRIKVFSISGTLLSAELTISDFYKREGR
jgi:hypothetical protein